MGLELKCSLTVYTLGCVFGVARDSKCHLVTKPQSESTVTTVTAEVTTTQSQLSLLKSLRLRVLTPES